MSALTSKLPVVTDMVDLTSDWSTAAETVARVGDNTEAEVPFSFGGAPP